MGDQTCYTDAVSSDLETRLANTVFPHLYESLSSDSSRINIPTGTAQPHQTESVSVETNRYVGGTTVSQYESGESDAVQSVAVNVERDALQTLRRDLPMVSVESDQKPYQTVLDAVETVDSELSCRGVHIDTVVASDSLIAPGIPPENEDEIEQRYESVRRDLRFVDPNCNLIRDTSGLLGSRELIVVDSSRLGYEVVNTGDTPVGIGADRTMNLMQDSDGDENSDDAEELCEHLLVWTNRAFVVTNDAAGSTVLVQ